MATKKREVKVMMKEENLSTNNDQKDTLTPAQYFQVIKDLKKDASTIDFKRALELAEKQQEKFNILKQTEASRQLNSYINMLSKEVKILEAGFSTYVEKKTIEEYIEKISDKCVFICELADYERDIDDTVFNRIKDHMDIFDHIYVMFTDYTQKISKHIDKKTREKDPIMFGCVELDRDGFDFLVGPRFYFIGDWVDEFCDLTLQEIIAGYEKEGTSKDEVVHDIKVPSTSNELKEETKLYTEQLKTNTKIAVAKTKKESD